MFGSGALGSAAVVANVTADVDTAPRKGVQDNASHLPHQSSKYQGVSSPSLNEVSRTPNERDVVVRRAAKSEIHLESPGDKESAETAYIPRALVEAKSEMTSRNEVDDAHVCGKSAHLVVIVGKVHDVATS